VLTYYSTEQNH